MMFSCGVCGIPYPTQREADLCTPEWNIPEIYGMASLTDEMLLNIPEEWLEE